MVSRLFSVSMVVASLFLAVGCGSSKSIDAAKVVGSWKTLSGTSEGKTVNIDGHYVMQFKQDGTVITWTKSLKKSESGKYRIEGDKIYAQMESDSEEKSANVDSLTDSEFVISENGTTMKMTRVTDQQAAELMK